MKELLNIKRFTLYFWIGIGYLLIAFISNAVSYKATASARNIDDAWRIIYIMVVNYTFFEYTLPKLSLKKFGTSLLRILMYMFLYSEGLYAWRGIGIALHIYIPVIEPGDDGKDVVASQMGYSVGCLIFFTIVRHVYNHVKLRRTAQQLRIEKQAAELNYLKSQTNPHFLFNTLNNIYALSRAKSDLAPESIMRLSKILRYMLYEAGGEYIAIEQELKIIDDYIALEKLRYDETLRVNFNYDVEDMKQALPPLLLMPLAENAFKHGVSETRNRPYVTIHLSVKNRQLTFTVKNSTEDAYSEGQVKENIGLGNLRRQLELLYTSYKLTINRGAGEFTAVLHINLASHV